MHTGSSRSRFFSLLIGITLSVSVILQNTRAQDQKFALPDYPLTLGVFVMQFYPGGTFSIEGKGWPTVNGSWKLNGSELELGVAPGGCEVPGRYRLRHEGKGVGFELVSDECRLRKMILNGSTWRSADEPKTTPVRRISHTSTARPAK